MPITPSSKPRLPSNYDVWCEPPDEGGDEVLHFVSERRRLKLKGHSFREFTRSVVPVLDGRHTWSEIQEHVADVFRPEDLAPCLELLSEHGILEDGGHDLDDEELARRIEPQLNLFHELEVNGSEAQKKLAAAAVSVVGLGGSGATAALSLAAAGVGTLKLIDSLEVREADVYFAPFLDLAAVGSPRASAARRMIEAAAPNVAVRACESELDSEAGLRAAVEGSDFIVCCLDAGQSNQVFKLNRVCLEAAIPWTSCVLAGTELVLGPTVRPGSGPCYLCYRMRVVACAANPEDAFDLERRLDRHKEDDSGRRENLVFAAGTAGNLVGMEVLKELTGMAVPTLRGKIAVVDLLQHSTTEHVVLRRPGCPACSGEADGREAAASVSTARGGSAKAETGGFDERLLELVSDRVGLIRGLSFPARGDDEPNPPLICQATLSHYDFRNASGVERGAGGKGRTKAEATAGAIGEALEQYCGSQFDSSRIRRAALDGLGAEAIAPSEFVLHSEAQYAARHSPYRQWSPSREIGWVTGRRVPDGAPVAVAASLVYTTRLYAEGEDFVAPANSNGMAAGPDMETAVLNGLYELIERDAFLVYWMNRLPAAEVEYGADGGLSSSIRAHYSRFGVELKIFHISTDLPAYVMMAIALDRTGDGPAALVGLGCHLDPGVAVLKASMEICQLRPGHVQRYRESPPGDRLKQYSDVRSMDDHGLFLAIPEHLEELDFLLSNGRREKLADLPARASTSAPADLERCAAALGEAGCQPVFVDVTTEDVAEYGLTVVRTLATGLQPMHFGHGLERLGGSRLFELPCRLGLASRPSTEADLNPCPHPLA